MAEGMFSSETYRATRLPLSRAAPLPGWCYTSPEWYEREIETIFRGPQGEWLCVGRVDQVPKPGDFYTIPLLGQPLIVVRDQENRIHVHSAVCRHRGAVIVEGEGNCRGFSCPYHSWSYRLDGRFAGAPGMAGVEALDKASLGLTPLDFDVWAGFIFVTFNPRPM